LLRSGCGVTLAARPATPRPVCADFRRYLSADLDRVCCDAVSAADVRTAHAGGRVRRLDWDSRFFGVPSGRLEMLWRDDSVPAGRAWDRLVPALLHRAAELGLVFLDVRIAAEELALAQALEAGGFRLVDALAVYLRDLGRQPSRVIVPAVSIDVAGFLREALADMHWGRLFADPRVARDKAEEFYFLSTLHYLESGAHTSVLVEAGAPVGLAIGIPDEEGSRLTGRRLGDLWLFIVSPRHKGKGFGKRLFNQFCAEFAARVELVEIGTQIQHVAANRIYRSAGDFPVAHALTFHRWAEPG